LPAFAQSDPVSLKARKWFIDPTQAGDVGSHGRPYKLAGGGLAFTFPISTSYGYLVRPWTTPVTGDAISMRLRVLRIDGTPRFIGADNPAGVQATVRFYIQSGSLYNSAGGNRWWSNPVCLILDSALDQGSINLICPLDSSMWSDTYGRKGDTIWGFADTLAHPTWIGMTFGAEFFGHGVWTRGGTAEFQLFDLSLG